MSARLRMGAISFEHGHQFSYVQAMLGLRNVELVAVSEPDPQLRGRAEAELEAFDRHAPGSDPEQGDVRVHGHHEDLIASPDIEAVCIASANVSHRELTVAAAEAGRHVLCEKPLAVSLDEATDMVRTCRQRGVTLATAYPVRHAPAAWEAKQRLASGALGAILTMNVTNLLRASTLGWFLHPERSGGGAIRDHIVHGTDLMRWFSGAEVRALYCEAATRMRDIAVEDTGMLVGVFDNGVVGSCDPSWNRPLSWPKWGDVTARILCERGVLEFDITGDFIVRTDAREAPSTQHVSFGPNMDRYLIDDFASALLEGRRPCATGGDGWAGVACIEAAYQSARTHRFVEVARIEDAMSP